MNIDEVASCRNCTYKQNTEEGFICSFHYMAIKENNVCDDFTDEFDTPLYHSYAGHNSSVLPQHLLKDVIAYLVSAVLIACFVLGVLVGIFAQ